MLILSRAKDEGIVIGSATVTVKSISGNRATFGIKAPNWMKILREELENKPSPPNNEERDTSVKASFGIKAPNEMKIPKEELEIKTSPTNSEERDTLMTNLTISRKVGESFAINGEATVTFVEKRGRRIQVGIKAGREIPIVRLEIANKTA